MDLQKAQQLRSDMQDIPTLAISTVSQFTLLPVADQEEILQMHKYDLLLKVAMENGIAVDDYAFRVLDLLEMSSLRVPNVDTIMRLIKKSNVT